jgi:hypothetical protein
VVETVRKLLQTAILVFVSPGSSLQMVYQALATIVLANILLTFQPYKDLDNNVLAVLFQWIIFFIAFIALLIKLDAEGASDGFLVIAYNGEVLNNFLIAFLFLGPSLVAIQILDESGFLDPLTKPLRARFRVMGMYGIAAMRDDLPDGGQNGAIQPELVKQEQLVGKLE